MSAGSLVGFGAVFVLVACAASLALAGTLRVLARGGVAVERRAAELAAAVPVALAAGVVAILVVESLLSVDHCGGHGHHAHLCLAHGEVWLERTWAVALVAASGAVVVTRSVLLTGAHLRARLLARRLARVASPVGDVYLVDSDRPFSFVAGIGAPRIFASTAALKALDPEEWDAMLAHERGHVVHRDLGARLRLDVMLLFAAPLVGLAIRERWELATERLRDAEAAERIGSPEAVASALVRMARTAPSTPSLLPAFSPRAKAGLTARVTALLDPPRPGDPRRLTRVALGALVVALAAGAILADPLHHALETLLG